LTSVKERLGRRREREEGGRTDALLEIGTGLQVAQTMQNTGAAKLKARGRGTAVLKTAMSGRIGTKKAGQALASSISRMKKGRRPAFVQNHVNALKNV